MVDLHKGASDGADKGANETSGNVVLCGVLGLEKVVRNASR